MKKPLIFLAALLCIASVSAQQKNDKPLKIKDGEDVTKSIPKNSQYIFEEFTDGTIWFKDQTAAGKLNYNIILEELQFVDPATGEVRTLANPQEVRLVKIGDKFFYPLGGKRFGELLVDGTYKLVVARKGELLDMGKKGAYGTLNQTAAIDTYSSMQVNNNTTSLETHKYIKVKEKSTFYVIVDGKPSMIKSSKSLLKSFPSDKAAKLKAYMEEKNLQVTELQDVISLVNYSNSL